MWYNTVHTVGTGFFPRVKSGRSVTLTPHPFLAPWSWKSRAISLLSLWAVRPVQSLSACTRVYFITLFLDCRSVCSSVPADLSNAKSLPSNSLEWNYFWKNNSSSARQEISHILLGPMYYCRFHISSPLFTTARHCSQQLVTVHNSSPLFTTARHCSLFWAK